jgi:hypothetical protein
VDVESEGTERGARGGWRSATLLSQAGHAVSVTGMSTTWISEPSIALTS